MPKTRKRSRSAAKTADTGDVENVLLRLLPTEFRTASVNLFQPTAFHSYLICVHILRFLVAIRLGCKKNLWARSEVCCRFTAACFLPFFGLEFDERKRDNLFFFFKDIHRFQKATTFACVLCLAVTYLSLFDNAMTRTVSG